MKKFILPALVILVGAGSAFATQTAKDKENKLIDRQGYIYNFSTEECDAVVMCSTEPGPICTSNGQQVFGTLGADEEHPLTCDVELYKSQN